MVFDSFSTEERWDFVKVYDGMSVTGTLLGEFSGTTVPGVLAAESGSVFVRFTSDGGGSEDGVGMRWSDTALATLAPTSSPTFAPTASPTFTGGTLSHAKPSEDARMLWRACITPGVLVCAGFALGARGSNDCPANCFRIVADDLCRSAAAAAGQLYQGRETNDDSPRGCYLYDTSYPRIGVFLNDATGSAPTRRPEAYRISVSKLLCAGVRLPCLQPSRALFGTHKGNDWVRQSSLEGPFGNLAAIDRRSAAVRSAIGPVLCGTPG